MRFQITKTDLFDRWLSNLKDRQALLAINKRIVRAINGNFGDTKAIAGGLFEMRVFVGKGYRIYYTIRGAKVVLLLCAGHKGTQKRDIKLAKDLLDKLGD